MKSHRCLIFTFLIFATSSFVYAEKKQAHLEQPGISQYKNGNNCIEVAGSIDPHEWKPGNAKNRYPNEPNIPPTTINTLPIAGYGKLVRDKISLMGPKGDKGSHYSTDADQIFNPAAFRDIVDGKEVIVVIGRSEDNKNIGGVHRQSFPTLSIYHPSFDGANARLETAFQGKPIFTPTLGQEKPGGIEDVRAIDLSLRPATHAGKSYSKMLTYVGYDGKDARVLGVLFNSWQDFDPRNPQFVKLGPMFRDADVMGSTTPESPWNKSAVILQYKDSKGNVRQVLWWNEGNHHHGGVRFTDLTGQNAGSFPYAKPMSGGEPHLKVRKGKFDQNLVEAAHAVHATLPTYFQDKLGIKQALILFYHGDSPNEGYQVGYAIYDPDNPNKGPIFVSDNVVLKCENEREISEGQVERVVFMPNMVMLANGQIHVFFGQGDKWIGHAQASRPTDQN